MTKFLFLAASLLMLFGFSAKQNKTNGNQRAYYKCTEPMEIDTNLFNPEQGKTYFHFNTELSPTDLKDFTWLKDSPKDYFTAYLVNTSDTTFIANRQDGSLIMIQEALNEEGKWQPIEYWVYSGCGNSYFDPLKLDPGKYAMIPVKKYSGSFNTKIRLKLKKDNTLFYSTPFEGKIEKSQFKKETGKVDGILYHGNANYLDPLTNHH